MHLANNQLLKIISYYFPCGKHNLSKLLPIDYNIMLLSRIIRKTVSTLAHVPMTSSRSQQNEV